MRETNRRQAWVRLTRMAVLGAGVLLLAGCATGYSFVQPGVAGSGGYYTSQGPYSGQGYYGTGPYYPGTSGYGYYNGSYPYSSPYGSYGGGYGYGYGPQLTFNLGISNGWNSRGYGGPWYATGYPSWGCYSRRCGYRHHRHDHDHQTGGDDTPRPWLKPDHPRVPPRVARGTPSIKARSQPVAQRPSEGFATRRPVDAAAFQHDRFVRAPRQQVRERFVGTPVRPAYTDAARMPDESTFASRRAMPTAPPATAPRNFNPSPRQVFRPAPSRVVAPAAPPSRPAPPRRSNTPSTKIQ